MSVGADVEKYIVEVIAPGAGAGIDSVDHDEDLLAQELIDSHGIVELVGFLEDRYGVKVDDDDLLPENFQTVNSVVALVERKGG